MKTKIILSLSAFICCLVLMSNISIMPNGDLRIGSGNTAIFADKIGRFNQSLGWDFDSGNSSNQGLTVENGVGESAGLFLDGDYAVIWSPGDQNRLLRIYDEDAMYNGSSSYEKAYIDGFGNYYAVSDEKRKDNITNVSGALSKISKIRGVNYKYKQETASTSKNENMAPLTTAGLLAQNVEAVIPEAVQTDKHGNKFMNYDSVIPYLVEAIKEQQAEIELLKAEIRKK